MASVVYNPETFGAGGAYDDDDCTFYEACLLKALDFYLPDEPHYVDSDISLGRDIMAAELWQGAYTTNLSEDVALALDMAWESFCRGPVK